MAGETELAILNSLIGGAKGIGTSYMDYMKKMQDTYLAGLYENRIPNMAGGQAPMPFNQWNRQPAYTPPAVNILEQLQQMKLIKELNAPEKSTTQSVYTFDAETGKLNKIGDVNIGSEIQKMAGTKTSAQKENLKAENLNVLAVSVDKMKKLIDKVPSGAGILGRVVGAIEKGKAVTGYGMETKTYEGYKNVVLGQIVKAIGGETGSRLSDQDVKRMANALPSVMETTKERKLKWQTFSGIVNAISSQYGGSDIFDTEGNILPITSKQAITSTNPTFKSEKEALNSSLSTGTEVIINGKRAIIRR